MKTVRGEQPGRRAIAVVHTALRQSFLWLWLGLGVSGLAHPSAAAAAEAASAAGAACGETQALAATAKVQARYDGIRDLAADFEQHSESVVLSGASIDEATPTKGEVVFAKPGRMRWTYREPEPSLLVSDGKVLWIHDIREKQASRLSVEQGYLAGAALQFLLGEGKLAETFEISASKCSQQAVELDLRPRETASYERLGLVVETDTGWVRETAITDLFGNRTRIRFENIRANLGPTPEVFEFHPPADVEVIDLSQPR